MMLKVDFQKLSEIGIFRKSKNHGWMLIWIINMQWAHDNIFDAGSNIPSLLLIFNKILVFRQQMLIFQHFPLSFMRKSEKWWKNNICCRKTTILLKISNNDAMLLSASIIATGASVDDSVANRLSEPKKSKNLDFGQKVKSDFELHICCHEYDLSDITNWQHIDGGTPDRNFCRNFCPPRPGTLNFHLWRRFFSRFDKINTCRQQKQLLLFLSNMTPKVLPT